MTWQNKTIPTTGISKCLESLSRKGESQKNSSKRSLANLTLEEEIANLSDHELLELSDKINEEIKERYIEARMLLS